MAKSDIGGVWRTVGGRRIFIKDGQDLASAMKESGKFKSAKKFSKREELKKDIAHQVTEAEKNGNTAHAEAGKRELERLNNEEKEQAVKDYENGKISAEDVLNKFYGQEDKMKEAFEKMGYTAPTKENIDKANANARQRAEERKNATKNAEASNEDVNVSYYDENGEKKTAKYSELREKARENFNKNQEKIKKMTEELGIDKKTSNDINVLASAEEQLMDFASISHHLDNLDNIELEYSPKGNIHITENGKDLVTVGRDQFTPTQLAELKKAGYFKSKNQKSDLMTAEQLKGKDREEQKEINKQYLKEQNKLAKEKGLISDYNKTDSRGSMSDDSFIEQARKNGMSDEQIAKEVYKKHNGPESNNTSDNNIKRLLAKQAKDEALAKGDKKRAETFENYEKKFESRTDDNQFTMYNSQYDKEVTVKKGADGKWVDSDGNKYMGYLSKQDVKQYFKGNWKESTEKRTASEIISSQMSKTKNAKIEVANALGLKYDNNNEWKSTSQLYKEQKGKDIANIAIDSSKADKYNAFVKKNYNREDKNFSDRAYIDKYAKDNNLDADALYYMTKVASESDRTKLKKKAFELYKKQHPNTKKTIYSFEDDIK